MNELEKLKFDAQEKLQQIEAFKFELLGFLNDWEAKIRLYLTKNPIERTEQDFCSLIEAIENRDGFLSIYLNILEKSFATTPAPTSYEEYLKMALEDYNFDWRMR
ncbi:hypothetical protein ACQP31_08825 [Actinobacillus pleuropneumoniae]|uniref:Uncharacterized protein n=2 Tax=Actinobacillus pleuropneumoniae TaxID=715 RepID=B3GYV2_ACTP7|nr:hypothetical protein [Actinobacillus pleuropneumoniae]ACE62438.1 hypothetical protein APP7_1786 [Actinobacillus pleuropneumoniae serovar 7 str. AP76]ASU15574.1 hypothetical protein CHY23_00802 [Actinobacillus pleuropneumoniae]AWG96140.1 hypothetical protein APPSER1_09435 [Actinobacillus pleuropneumoniae serovar 1 str. 4074]AXA22210.1 hypothetical protein DRF63_09430 [Actinobacillus pleuropneumoniae]EFM93475.1 hypothetical protein appser9_18620 [Actinobacillus pleuropneumoniae serovar 9 str.